MHTSPQTTEERSEILSQAISDIQFGALVHAALGELAVSHLPMLLRKGGDGAMLLEGHVSRANDIWHIGAGARALAIFQGPQAYIHPGWYPTKKRDGRVVPSWNYIAVYARGTLEVIEDGRWLREHVEALTAKNEAQHVDPWAIDDAPPEFIETMIKGIVGLSLRVETIVGTWKMGQKHPLENRLGAASGLSSSPQGGDCDVGLIMERLANEQVR